MCTQVNVNRWRIKLLWIYFSSEFSHFFFSLFPNFLPLFLILLLWELPSFFMLNFMLFYLLSSSWGPLQKFTLFLSTFLDLLALFLDSLNSNAYLLLFSLASVIAVLNFYEKFEWNNLLLLCQ